MACFASKVRISHWISEDATVRARYHDTLQWSEPILPRCDSDGCLCTVLGLGLPRAMALAWMPDERGTRVALKRPEDGVQRDNVEWRGIAAAHYRGDRSGYTPPCALRLMEALRHNDHIMADAARACGISVSTAWNYAAVVLTSDMDSSVASRIVPPDMSRAIAVIDNLSGSIRDVASRVHDAGCPITPASYNALRIARVYELECRRPVFDQDPGV